MSGEPSSPSIRVDLKKNRIIVTRKALKVIGDPEYILLLVNPAERTLAVLKSSDAEQQAHRVRKIGKAQVEFYSKVLLKALLGLCSNWQDNCSYKIDADAVQDEGIIKFHIDKAVAAGE